MRSWHVITNGGQADLSISGETLPGAINEDFSKIATAFNLGNAAGYRLESVKVAPQGDTSATLVVESRGMDLAHRPADPTTKRTKVVITGLKPGDLPDAVDLIPTA
jgi:hypothetical protein